MTATRNAPIAPTTQPVLSPWRTNMMRAGFLLMVVGLAIVKWPLLGQASELPLFEGVTLCLLTAMSLLALLGLRHPVKMLRCCCSRRRGSSCGWGWSPSPTPSQAGWTRP